MAEVKIRGRVDPVIVTNERAIKVKEIWKDLRNPRSDIMDLDTWCGELGRIVDINLDTARLNKYADQDRKKREEDAEREAWKRQPPSDKAKTLGHFKLTWWARNGMKGPKEPPELLMKKAYEIALAYYTKYPHAEGVPLEAFSRLLPDRNLSAKTV